MSRSRCASDLKYFLVELCVMDSEKADKYKLLASLSFLLPFFVITSTIFLAIASILLIIPAITSIIANTTNIIITPTIAITNITITIIPSTNVINVASI